jgi:hypothetical protein
MKQAAALIASNIWKIVGELENGFPIHPFTNSPIHLTLGD